MARTFRSKRQKRRRLTIGPDTTLERSLIIRPVSLAGRKVTSARSAAGGVLDLGKGYDFSSGTGSYAIGFQGRYDYMDASHHVFGVEGDIWFPNTLSGNQTFTTPRSAPPPIQKRFSSRALCAHGSDMRPAIGCSISRAGSPGVLTSSPAHKTRARPLEAMRQPGPRKVSLWSPDTAEQLARGPKSP